jgi:hypothetical protein
MDSIKTTKAIANKISPIAIAKVKVSQRNPDSRFFSVMERDLMGFEVETLGEVMQILGVFWFYLMAKEINRLNK